MTTSRKKSPCGAAGATQVRGYSDKRSKKPTLAPDGRPAGQYWLHIKASGEELWLGHQPAWLKCLRVEVIDLGRGRTVEQTKTWCREECDVVHKKYGYCLVCIYPVRPRGMGWRMHDNASDKFTVWRQPRGAGRDP